MLSRLRTGAKMVTVGFVTINPSILLKFIKHLLIGIAMVVSMALVLNGHPLPKHEQPHPPAGDHR